MDNWRVRNCFGASGTNSTTDDEGTCNRPVLDLPRGDGDVVQMELTPTRLATTRTRSAQQRLCVGLVVIVGMYVVCMHVRGRYAGVVCLPKSHERSEQQALRASSIR